MADPKKKEQKEETLKEYYNRLEEYDPSTEEVRACYNDEFNEWCDNFFKDKK